MAKGKQVAERMEGQTCPVINSRCVKKDCAWWDGHYNCCAVLSSAILLERGSKKERKKEE